MAKIKLSDYIAKYLKNKGVDLFFTVSGGGAMHLNDSLGNEIKYIANHHEQASSFAAEGYFEISNKLAVVNVTTGPGGLNCLNGLFGQWTDSIPVLYISGQVKYETSLESCPQLGLRQLGDQEVDIISTVKHLTKYAKTVLNPDEIKYHLDRAIHEATSKRKGPVWLNIPMNVQSALIEENNLKGYEPKIEEKTKIDFEQVINSLLKSKKPLIIAGHGVRLSNMQEEFAQLVQKLKIPVVTTFRGYDIIKEDNPYYIGRIGTVGQRAGNFAVQNADLIICLGTRNNIRQISYNIGNFAKNAKKIVVDIDEAELNKPTFKPDIKICADLADFIKEFLNSEFDYSPNPDWNNFCTKLKEKYSPKNHPEHEKTGLINPYYLTEVLGEVMEENDIFVMANGSACVCGFQNTIVKKGQRHILNSGNASMGYGLPAAIGACVAAQNNKRGERVICLEGDGSIMMNLQELQTVVHHKLPIKIFIINNNGYSSIKQTQKNFFNRYTACSVESGVSMPDFCAVGKAFKIKTFKLTEPRELKKEISEILALDDPVICEVITESEYEFRPKLSSKKLPDGSIVSSDFEDLYPFLDRKEYSENFYEK